MKIPTWDDCKLALESGEVLNPLERFVYENEIIDDGQFRKELADLILFVEESVRSRQDVVSHGETLNSVDDHETGNVNDKQDREVGILYISLFRGHLENTHFDYYGDLSEGSYSLYLHPDNSALRKVAKEFYEWALYHMPNTIKWDEEGKAENLRAALEEK